MHTNRFRLIAPVMAGVLIAGAAAPVAAQTAAPAAPPAPNGVGSAFELTFWQSVTGSEDVASYEAYLARYPDGTFSGLARARIAAIQRAMAVQPATAPAAAPTATPAPAPQPAPAVLTMPAAEAPLAPTPAAAVVTPTPAAAPVALAEAAPSPMARLLAQLRAANGEPSPQPAVVAAAPAQPLQTPAAAAPAAALTPAATSAVSYASGRPFLIPVPEVVLPAYFCSNDARNAFHNNAYRPAVEVATRNNEAAVAYLRQLQQTYDRGQLGRDTAVLNAIAAEARAYQAEAARAYSVQATLVRQFDAMMAVPLQPCAATAQ